MAGILDRNAAIVLARQFVKQNWPYRHAEVYEIRGENTVVLDCWDHTKRRPYPEISADVKHRITTIKVVDLNWRERENWEPGHFRPEQNFQIVEQHWGNYQFLKI